MHMTEFSAMNRARCESPSGFNQALASWSLSDWFTATTGELGEAANVAKKLNRVRDGIPGNSETPEQLRQNLADEIADVFIYLDLLAQSEGICLEQAVLSKFDKTSRKRGYIGDGLSVNGSPLAGRELAADLADGCSR
jgi:NTP pyrophosphatase (non-canonical NTP hydrolase)